MSSRRQKRTTGGYTSYKELMRNRRNKQWQRNQRINFDSGSTATQLDQQKLQEPPIQAGPERIETYGIEGVGKLKVNANLKNLLLN